MLGCLQRCLPGPEKSEKRPSLDLQLGEVEPPFKPGKVTIVRESWIEAVSRLDRERQARGGGSAAEPELVQVDAAQPKRTTLTMAALVVLSGCLAGLAATPTAKLTLEVDLRSLGLLLVLGLVGALLRRQLADQLPVRPAPSAHAERVARRTTRASIAHVGPTDADLVREHALATVRAQSLRRFNALLTTQVAETVPCTPCVSAAGLHPSAAPAPRGLVSNPGRPRPLP